MDFIDVIDGVGYQMSMQNQAAAQPSPHFKDASARPKIPPLGYLNETSEAINNNDLLSKATDSHHANRKLKGPPAVHEGNHVVLSLLSHTHPELMVGKNYQANAWAEAYVIGMQNYLRDTTYTRADFIRDVQEVSATQTLYENQSRVVAWLLFPFSDKTIWDIQVESPLSLNKQIDAIGIGMTSDESDTKKGKIITITSPEYGIFTLWDSVIEFPEDFPGRDMIVPFTVPTDDEAGAMFDALEPAMKLLRAKGKTDPTAPSSTLSDITVGEIVERLRDGISSDLGKNAVRGADVQPA